MLEIDADATRSEQSPATDDILLRMTAVTKHYGPVRVLHDVDFDLRAGEIHALMGENGAGKSTLIKVLTGVTRADSGRIEIAGNEVSIRSTAGAKAHGIAVVHQEFSVLPNLTVRENLFLHREKTIAGIALDVATMRRESVAILARLGLTIDPETPVEELDVAERQAIEICRALAEDARILVLDEPTAALTDAERERLFAVLEQLRSEGLGLIYVSHHLGEISRLADRVTVLRNGRKVLTTPKAEIDEDGIVHAMLGEPVTSLFPPKSDAEGLEEPIIAGRGIRYGRKVRGIDIDVRRGEILGITGLVGSGHRELGRLLSGTVAPTAGRLESPAKSVTRLVPGDRKREGLAIERTGSENLSIYALKALSYARGLFLSRKKERAFTDEHARRLRLRGSAYGPVGSLSGGNQQKILVGRALDSGADVIVLEEPTRGVDVGARSDLYELIRAEAVSGVAVVVVSTDLREIAGLCDRVVVLNRGEVSAEIQGEDLDESSVYRAAHADGSDDEVDEAHVQHQSRLGAIVRDESFVPWAAFAVLAIIAGIGSPIFFGAENVSNLARQSVTTGLVGLGQLFVVLAGHVDLSMGSTVGLTNLISAQLFMDGWSIPAVTAVVLGVGVVIGSINAVLVRLGMPALLATFAMASVLRGIIVWAFPKSVGPVPEEIWAIDRGEVFGIPLMFLVVVAAFVVAAFVLRRTPFGRHLYATGGDEHAARLTGINTTRILVAVFVTSSCLAALAGLHLTARAGAGLPNSGTGLEFDALAVVMIGGAALTGGRGTIRGLVAGIGIVLVLANMMNLLGFDAFIQSPVKGAIIVVVAILWAMRDRARRDRARLGLRFTPKGLD